MILDRLIESLGAVSEDSSHVSGAAIDLSAALLVRFARFHRATDLLHALEAALAAADRDQQSAAARFNAAVAAREAKLVLTEQAQWRAYLELDSTTRWADEARAHLADAQSRPVLSARAPDEPQALRERITSTELELWATGVLAGDFQRSDRAAARIRASARQLSDSSRDQTVALVAAALPARASEEVEVRSLAFVGSTFTAAQRAYAAARYDSAHALFSVVLQREAPPVLKSWARLGVAAALMYVEGPSVARPSLEAIIVSSSPHLPALRARARWMLGTALLREGRHTESIASFAVAESLFVSCGERENAAAARYLQGEARLGLGAYDDSGALLIRALNDLATFPTSIWRHNTLIVLTKLSGAFGLHRVEAAVAQEDVMVAATLLPVYRVEAALTRARLDVSSFHRDLVLADSLLPLLPPGPTRAWLEAQAIALRATDTTLSVTARLALLDSAAEFFQSRSVTRWLPVLSLRASVLLDAGRIMEALRDLRASHAALERERQRLTAEGSRVRLLNQVRRVYEALAATLVANGDTIGGLRAVEETRSIQTRVDPERPPFSNAQGNESVVAVTFAMNGDSLLSWTQDGRSLSFNAWPASRHELAQLLLELRSPEILGSDTSARQHAILRRLYDLLLAPLDRRVHSAHRLQFGVGGMLATVPYAALTSPDDRYLVERSIVSVAGRARPYSRAQPMPRRSTPAILLAARRGATASAEEALSILEAESMRQAFPSLQELHADSLDTRQFISALQEARVVHFAGHAFGDSRVPGDGYLSFGAGIDGVSRQLSSGAVAQLKLPHAELVVLAACESGRVMLGTDSEALPLARAFLVAGARVVIGTLWEVDDRATGALLTEFYVAIAVGKDPAEALRQAQLKMLQHVTPAFRSPAAWAGYTVNFAS